MFIKKHKNVYILLFVLLTVTSPLNAASQILNVTATSSLMISATPTVPNTKHIHQNTFQSPSSSITSSVLQSTTPKMNDDEENKLKPWVIAVISVSAAVVFIVIIILLLVCIFRRRRIQRLKKERNLSYNNMNYESTVKFRSDMETDGATLKGDPANPSPRTTNNNPKRDAGYERVDLPSDNTSPSKPQYENVTPQNVKKPTEQAEPRQAYENVTPMVSSANDKANSPVAPYEQVFLDSPKETNGDQKKTNDKYYENVQLKI